MQGVGHLAGRWADRLRAQRPDAARRLRPRVEHLQHVAAQISTATGKFWGGAILPDGKIVFAPQNYGAPLIVDPVAGTWADGPAMSGTNLSAGALALPDGRVLFVPNRNPNLVLYRHLTGGQVLTRAALMSRHFNTAF